MAVSPAVAADDVQFGPAPAWVRPVEAPKAPTKSSEVPARLLLSSQQVNFEAGRQSVYLETAIRIESPQGLAAGNIALPWNPATDALTVHRLTIERGDRSIDVLAAGQKFTVVRREANLENATLDGVLTASIQPEGLQVGDTLRFAATIVSADPTLKGHVEQVGAAWNIMPVDRAHLRMQWPQSMRVQVRASGALPPVRPVNANGTSSIELALDAIEPVPPPKGAPARYAVGRLVEASDFRSWAEIGALLAPLYDKAAAVPASGALRSELDKIRTASSDPRVRAEAALALVQDRVRYVALLMGTGGLVPADAEQTWSRRYGDCKAKTALLLALLKGLEIQADPVAVNAISGDGIDQRLPMIGLFNHVVVRATIAGKTYWLDGTRTGDAALERLKVPNFGWGLPLVARDAALVRIVPPPLEVPEDDVSIRIDATAGVTLPAPTKIVSVTRGDDALGTSMALNNLSGDARERSLREFWRSRYDFIEVDTVASAYDPKAGTLTLTMTGKARMEWKNGWYETDGTGVGYRADFTRDPGPNRDAPYAVPYPFFERVEETILLPRGFDKEQQAEDLNQTVAGIEYRRTSVLRDRTFKIVKTARSVAPEFPAKDAPAAQAVLRTLADKTVYLRVPPGYRATEAERAAVKTTSPTTAQEYLRRGIVWLDEEKYDEAIADFDRAVALDPKDAWALGNRAMALAWKKDDAGAVRDIEAALALDPDNFVALQTRGILARQSGDPKAAVAAFSSAIAANPESDFAYYHRAVAHRMADDSDAALADLGTVLKINPRQMRAHMMRINMLRSAGRSDEALQQVAAMVAANGDDSYAMVAAGKFYAALDQPDDAVRAFDAALAIKPEAYIYVNRADTLPKADLAGRRADIAAAEKLSPTDDYVLAAKAKLQLDSGDAAGAVKSYDRLLATNAQNAEALGARGMAYVRLGDAARGERDFVAARARADGATGLNNLCWDKATQGIALQAALADCDAALRLSPGAPAYLDSRGLVLLRLGRLDEAIAAYDAALAKAPRQPASLFGRGLARARKGDKTRSAADIAAARARDASIDKEFAGYGLAP